MQGVAVGDVIKGSSPKSGVFDVIEVDQVAGQVRIRPIRGGGALYKNLCTLIKYNWCYVSKAKVGVPVAPAPANFTPPTQSAINHGGTVEVGDVWESPSGTHDEVLLVEKIMIHVLDLNSGQRSKVPRKVILSNGRLISRIGVMPVVGAMAGALPYTPPAPFIPPSTAAAPGPPITASDVFTRRAEAGKLMSDLLGLPEKLTKPKVQKDTLPPLVTQEAKAQLRENVRKNMGITGTRYKCPHIACLACAHNFKTVREVKDHHVAEHGEHAATSMIETTKYKVNL